MIKGLINQGSTEGQNILPHILDWISAAVALYLGLLSRLTPVTRIEVAVAVLILLIHTIYIGVHIWYTPHDARVNKKTLPCNLIYSCIVVVV